MGFKPLSFTGKAPIRRPADDLPAGEQADWLCRAADAFQKVVLCAAQSPIDVQRLALELSGIPVPRTHFERLAARYLICECFAAISSGGATLRPPRPREFVALVRASRGDSNPIARFSKLIMALCRPAKGQDVSLADRIGRRIEKDYASRITAKRLAGECHVTRTQLDHSFIQRFGIRLHEYLTVVRLRHGLDLVTGGMKVEAAAAAVGYQSKKDFYRAVRLRTGFTPGQLRRRRSADSRFQSGEAVRGTR